LAAEEIVVSGVTNQGATVLGPGAIRHTGCGATYIASNGSSPAHVQGEFAAAVLREAGFAVEELQGPQARER